MQRKKKSTRSFVLKLLWISTAAAAMVLLVFYYQRLGEINDSLERVQSSKLTGVSGLLHASHIQGEENMNTIGKIQIPDNNIKNSGNITEVSDGTESDNAADIPDNTEGDNAADIPGGMEGDNATDILGSMEGDNTTNISGDIESYNDSEIGGSADGSSITDIPNNAAGEEDEETTSDKRIIDPEKPMIALTFDDGPSESVTGRILDVLKENDARATFFMVGYNIANYKDIVKRVYDSGCQIGNHTMNHKSITDNSDSVVKEEVEGNSELLNSIVPVGDIVLRPPYGSYNEHSAEIINVPMICWSVDSLDWKSRKKDSIIKEITSEVKDGYVILMHDLYKSTADAVEYLVPKLIEDGYQLVTINELFSARGEKLENGHVYRYTKSAEKYIAEKKAMTEKQIQDTGHNEATVLNQSDRMNNDIKMPIIHTSGL